MINITSNSTKKESKYKNSYEVHFNVYLPPIFKMKHEEAENFDIGIYTDFNNWSKPEMNVFPIKTLRNNGYLVYGKVKVPLNVKKFQYKYLLRFNEEKSYMIEFLGDGINREFEFSGKIDSVINIYDGIMLPPDKKSENIFQILKKTVKKWVGGIFYNETLYNEHEDGTIRAMLHEIKTNDEINFKTLGSATNYLDNVFQGLKKNFKDNSHVNQVTSIKI